MGPSLALKNLKHGKVRTLVAVGGVCFAVTLLFMQLGFFGSVSLTAMLVYDKLNFDILLTSPQYVVLTQTGSFPRKRLAQARALPDVEIVMPLYVKRAMWRNPDTRLRRAVVALGINPRDPVSRVPELEQQRSRLARPDTVLIDRLSRPEVGPQDSGLVTDVGPRNLETIGQVTIGPGFEFGLIVVSDLTWSRLFGGRPLDDVSLGLVKLRPGADREQVAAQLSRILPRDVQVLTRDQLEEKERTYWLVSTSTGIIFGCGVLVAILFGVVITYQVMSLEVSHRLSEYATLKAMGFSDRYLSLVVLQQAVIFALVSFVPAYGFALGIYHLSHSVTKLPIEMTLQRAAIVFFVNLALCCISGLMALRILRRADPVDLF
jgi:putative ABC transport system permease protein